MILSAILKRKHLKGYKNETKKLENLILKLSQIIMIMMMTLLRLYKTIF